MKTQTLTGNWQFRQANTTEWLPAQVPGGVHTDLMAAGRIPDPFVGDNEKRVQWVAESDWEYRHSFTVDPALLEEDKVFLVCDGLDTLAEVALNGIVLDQTDNMFRQYRWQVKSLLKAGQNEVAVFFPSPVQFISKRQAKQPMHGVSQAIPGGPYLRKAPCQFGWDWGPMLPPIGVWKDIRLEGYSIARLAEIHLRQEHAHELAFFYDDLQTGEVKIEAGITIEQWQDTDLQARLLVTTPDGRSFENQAVIFSLDNLNDEENDEDDWETEYFNDDLDEDDIWLEEDWIDEDYDEDEDWFEPEISRRARGDIHLEVRLQDPELWWPNGYGDQPLYQVEVILTHEGLELDRRAFQLGLRTLELRRQPDEWGESFTFVVNDTPIFAKGANWIPADSFPTRLSDERLEDLFRSAIASHQNMLRVWGGGFYEEDRFYELCDRYGVLVWQDCIFSCSVYPLDDPAFLENVRREIEDNVRRLRHHASLALWCGNNEMEWGWEMWGWDKPELQPLKEAYDHFFHYLLPKWIDEEDPDHEYWPSSPSSNTPFENANDQRQGDTHYWDVWHGRKPFTAYRSQFPRFMSEFGFQSLPPLETIRTYAEEGDWNMTAYMMEHHQRNAAGNGLMIGQMTDTFRMPKDFPALVYLSMVLQAEGIRYGVEHWRRNKQRVSGTLYWQLNDCWPVASWASLDYFGRWKALHYAARRFYAPVLLSIEEEIQPGTMIELPGQEARMNVWVTSDLLTPFDGFVRWELVTLTGEALKRGQLEVALPSLQSAQIASLSFQLPEELRRQTVFHCELWQGDKLISRQLATFIPNKHLALSDPELGVSVSVQDDQLTFEVAAQSLARFVELSLAGADVVFSDNYFDIPAGRSVTVTCPLPAGWTLEKAEQSMQVRSLYNSF